MMNIICFGEALIDFKQTGHLSFDGVEGGSPMNVAIAAARLGSKTGFAGQVSADLFGQALRTYLGKNAVDTRFLLESDAPTTLAFVAEIGGDVHYSFMNHSAADTLYDPKPRPTLPDTVKFIQFGSISLLIDPTASSITDIVALHQDKASIVFDPNVRPALIPDKTLYLKTLSTWLELSHIVKVSTQDLEWLYPNISKADIADDWLEYDMQALIITDGGEGVTLYRAGQAPLNVSTPKVEVVDTVGAGDTLTGSLMSELLKQDCVGDFDKASDALWTKVLKFAATAAAINCTRSGAQPPTRADIASFQAQST